MPIVHFVCISKRLNFHWLYILRSSNIQELRYLDKKLTYGSTLFLIRFSPEELKALIRLPVVNIHSISVKDYYCYYQRLDNILLRCSVKLKKASVSICIDACNLRKPHKINLTHVKIMHSNEGLNVLQSQRLCSLSLTQST